MNGLCRREGQHSAPNGVLDGHVSDRMRRHIEQQKVALLCAQYALFYEALAQALTDLLELEMEAHHIPRFTTEQVHPFRYARGRRVLNVSDRLVEKRIGCELGIRKLDMALRHVLAFLLGATCDAYAAAESELHEYATTQRKRQLIVPEREVSLCVLESEQEHLFHEREPGVPLLFMLVRQVARIICEAVPCPEINVRHGP